MPQVTFWKSLGRFWRARVSWLGAGGQPVPPPRAQGRANVCLRCPMNKEMGLYEGLAKIGAGILRRQIEAKSHLKVGVLGEERLHVCSACGCNLALKVQVPLMHILETTDTAKLHPNCWILREMKLA